MKSKRINYNKSRKTKKKTLSKLKKSKRKNSKIVKGGRFVASGTYGSVYGYGSEKFKDDHDNEYMVGVPPFSNKKDGDSDDYDPHLGLNDDRYVCKIFISDDNNTAEELLQLQQECDNEYNFFDILELSPVDLRTFKKYSIVPECKGIIKSNTLNDRKYLNKWRTNIQETFSNYLPPGKFITNDYPMIVYENGGVDLNRYLSNNLLNQDTPLLQKTRIIHIFSGVKNLLEAIHFMSSRNIFHSDIKSGNIVTCILDNNDHNDHNKNFKLIDWGLGGKITSPHSRKLISRIEDFYEINFLSYNIYPPVCFGILYSICLLESTNDLDEPEFSKYLNNGNEKPKSFILDRYYTNQFIDDISMFYDCMVDFTKFDIDGYFNNWQINILKILRQKTFGLISFDKPPSQYLRIQRTYYVKFSDFKNIIKKYLKFYRDSENENIFDVDKVLRSIDIYSFGILLIEVFTTLVNQLFEEIKQYADNNSIPHYKMWRNQKICDYFNIKSYIQLFDKVYQVIIQCCYLPEEENDPPLYNIGDIVTKYDEILHTN
jgi:serine/threonine protein kinase